MRHREVLSPEPSVAPEGDVASRVCAALAGALLAALLLAMLGGEARAAQMEMEAETMALSGSRVVVHSSDAASGGEDVAFYSDGSATASFDGAAASVTLRAKGKPCEGDPRLDVYVDGALEGSVYLTSSAFADHEIALGGLSGGAHALRVSYPNDHSTGACDRNAYLDYYALDLPDASSPEAPPTGGGDPVLVGAGKIGACNSPGDEATARLLDSIPGTVFTAGDNAYESGTAAAFRDCYGPTWGRHKARTMPSPGRHDYYTAGASGYFGYFGAAAGDPNRGYYSYNLGEWHVIALNSMCEEVGGCGESSPMVSWLERDLAANPRTCTAAYFNHPLFSSGRHGDQAKVRPIWEALYAANADVVVNGRDHDYERFAPQSPGGAYDPTRGIRQFVVGTGGAHHAAWGTTKPNSQVRNNDTYGVLKLTLRPGGYDWRFVPEAGRTFTDSGSSTCH